MWGPEHVRYGWAMQPSTPMAAVAALLCLGLSACSSASKPAAHADGSTATVTVTVGQYPG
jgi:hypothetical protein